MVEVTHPLARVPIASPRPALQAADPRGGVAVEMFASLGTGRSPHAQIFFCLAMQSGD